MNPRGCSAVFEHVLLAETTAWRLGPLCFAFRGLVWGFLLRPWGLLILHVTPRSWLWLLPCSPTLSAFCLSHLLLHIRKPDVNKWPHISNLFMKYSFYCFKIDWSLAHREKKKRKENTFSKTSGGRCSSTQAPWILGQEGANTPLLSTAAYKTLLFLFNWYSSSSQKLNQLSLWLLWSGWRIWRI